MGGSIEGLIEPFLRHMQGRGQTERNVRSFYGYPLRSVLMPFCARCFAASLTAVAMAERAAK